MCLDSLDFFTNFSKSMKMKDNKLNILMVIIKLRIQNGPDHELGAHKSAEN